MLNRQHIEVRVSNRGKRTVTLLAALVFGSGLVGLSARAGEPNEVSPPTAETEGSFLSDPNLARQSDLSLGSGELFVKMMLSVVLVIVLAVAVLYLSKRVLPKVTKASGKEIRVTETSYLGPRKALHLVEIGNQKLLIGSTNESITTLAHIGDAWLDLSKSETENAVSP